MMRPGKRAAPGTNIVILDKDKNPSAFTATVREINAEGHRRLAFSGPRDLKMELDALGETPLPPYIERAGEQPADRERYQTVYARAPGSVAAPTAGLHFTQELLEKIRARGTRVSFVTTQAGEGRTRLFIHPPYEFKTVDALVTNFHLPRSTLLMLVSAFAAPGATRGRDLILRAYEEAVARRYRFFSYGDAMLLL